MELLSLQLASRGGRLKHLNLHSHHHPQIQIASPHTMPHQPLLALICLHRKEISGIFCDNPQVIGKKGDRQSDDILFEALIDLECVQIPPSLQHDIRPFPGGEPFAFIIASPCFSLLRGWHVAQPFLRCHSSPGSDHLTAARATRAATDLIGGESTEGAPPSYRS